MEIVGFLFAFHMIGMFALTLFKLYNIFNGSQVYDASWMWLTFIGSIMVWFVGLVVILFNYVAIYGILFRFTSVLMVLSIILTLIETGLMTGREIKSFKSSKSS